MHMFYPEARIRSRILRAILWPSRQSRLRGHVRSVRELGIWISEGLSQAIVVLVQRGWIPRATGTPPGNMEPTTLGSSGSRFPDRPLSPLAESEPTKNHASGQRNLDRGNKCANKLKRHDDLYTLPRGFVRIQILLFNKLADFLEAYFWVAYYPAIYMSRCCMIICTCVYYVYMCICVYMYVYIYIYIYVCIYIYIYILSPPWINNPPPYLCPPQNVLAHC